jgi:multiple sugar transport system permease protein
MAAPPLQAAILIRLRGMMSLRQRILFLAPFAVFVAAFIVGPAMLGFYSSFTDYDPRGDSPIRFVGASNYILLISDMEFQSAVRNAALFVPATVIIEMILGVVAAYELRKPFRGRGVVRVILLVPWLISPVANGLMWRFLFHRKTGLLNLVPALLGLPSIPDLRGPGFALAAVTAIEIWRKAPFVGFLVLPAMLAIPLEQWDLAELEGMSHIARIRHIVIPRLRRSLLTVMFLLFGDSVGTFEGIFIFYGGGPRLDTITPGFFSYWKAFKVFSWRTGAASAWLIAAAVLIIGVCYCILMRRGET